MISPAGATPHSSGDHDRDVQHGRHWADTEGFTAEYSRCIYEPGCTLLVISSRKIMGVSQDLIHRVSKHFGHYVVAPALRSVITVELKF